MARILAQLCRTVNGTKGQGMAHGDQFGSAWGPRDPPRARHLKRGRPLGFLGKRFRTLGDILDEGGTGLGLRACSAAGGDVDHGGAAAFVVVGEFGHRQQSAAQQSAVRSQQSAVSKEYIQRAGIATRMA